MDVRAFDFDLPPELIAQEPASDRGAARLLCLDRETGATSHATVTSLPERITPGDLGVVNGTPGFPARLPGRRVPSGGAVECLLVNRLHPTGLDDARWEALMHPGQKLREGAAVIFEGSAAQPTVHGEVLERRFHGRRVIRLWTGDGSRVDDAVDAIGHVPLPPYIKRADRPDDRDRYQTVFARARGSVAAPTAGLHFSRALVEALGDRGVEM